MLDQIARKTLQQVTVATAVVTFGFIMLLGGALQLGGGVSLLMTIGQVVSWGLLRGGSQNDTAAHVLGSMPARQRMIFTGINAAIALCWLFALGTTDRVFDMVISGAGLAVNGWLAYAAFKHAGTAPATAA